MYLVDTNVFLEGLLRQEKVDTVEKFFNSTDFSSMVIPDLSLHSIGIILFKLGKHEVFDRFLNDMIIDGMEVLTLLPVDLNKLNSVAKNFGLDFDDAYQYSIADLYDLTLISFDKDFDRTERGRKEPNEALV